MTSNDIKTQIRDDAPKVKKVEVFTCGQYANNHEIRTETISPMAAAFMAAASK